MRFIANKSRERHPTAWDRRRLITWAVKALKAIGLSSVAVAVLVVVQGIVMRRQLPDFFTSQPESASVRSFHAVRGHGHSLVLYSTSRRELIDGELTNTARHYLIDMDGLPPGQHGSRISFANVEPRWAIWTGERRKIFMAGWDSLLYTWDARVPREQPRRLSDHPQFAEYFACSSDGRLLITAGDQLISAWDLTTHKQLWQRQDCQATCIALQPISASVLCGTFGGDLLELDAATGRTLRTVAKHHGVVRDVAICPTGKQIATIGYDHRLQVADWDNGVTHWSAERNDLGVICFSQAGDMLVSAGSADSSWQLFLWDARTGKRLGKLRGHTKAIFGAMFGRDGALYSWSADGTIRAWDPRGMVSTGVFTPNLLSFSR
jgi:WD40 repeat protein